MEVINHKGVDYNKADVQPTESVISKESIQDIVFEKEKCVKNAHQVADKLKILCIEGFVVCFVTDGKSMGQKVIRHCWNKIGDKHFDVTKDFVWGKFEFAAQEFYYYPVAEFSPSQYNFLTTDLFLSDVVEIAAELDKGLQEEVSKENNVDETEG